MINHPDILINNKTERIDEKIARPFFVRGLRIFGEYIVCGISPASIIVFKKGVPKSIESIQLSHDIRNAIHGIHIIEDKAI